MTEYIEREAVLKQARFIHGKWDDRYISETNIKNMPDADVTPVVRGKWIKTYDEYDYYYYCSVCRQIFYFKGINIETIPHNYCPNCGARMGDANE